MPFLLAEILNFQGSTHRIGVGSFSILLKDDSFDRAKVLLSDCPNGINIRYINCF